MKKREGEEGAGRAESERSENSLAAATCGRPGLRAALPSRSETKRNYTKQERDGSGESKGESEGEFKGRGTLGYRKKPDREGRQR